MSTAPTTLAQGLAAASFKVSTPMGPSPNWAIFSVLIVSRATVRMLGSGQRRKGRFGGEAGVTTDYTDSTDREESVLSVKSVVPTLALFRE